MRPRLSHLCLFIATLFFPLASPLKLTNTFLEIRGATAQTPITQNQTARAAMWRAFSSAKGGFRVLMPGTPTEQIQSAKPGDRAGDLHMFLSAPDNGRIAYVVGYRDVPRVPEQASPSQINKIFNTWRNGTLGNGKLIRERTIKLEGSLGREIEFIRSDGLINKARIYWVKQRLYMLLAAATTEAELSQGADKFLNSFKLLTDTATETSSALAQAQTTQDRKAEADRLSEKGTQQINGGQLREALATFQQVLVFSREIGDRFSEGVALNNIGLVYFIQGHYPKALQLYQRALAIHTEIGNRVGKGMTLTNIGSFYIYQGQYPKALNIFEQALAIHTEIGNHEGEIITLCSIGAVYNYLGQLPKALETLQQALDVSRESGYRMGDGQILDSFGTVYTNQGQYQRALNFYQQALAIHRKVGYRLGESITLDNIGGIYDEIGQYAQALKSYQQALAISREIGYRMGEVTTLNKIGNVYSNLSTSSQAQALKSYQQALAISREISYRTLEGLTLSNIGKVYTYQGQYTQALQSFQQALATSRKIGDRIFEGVILSNIGKVYTYQGQYTQALKSFQQALAIEKKIGDRAGEGKILHNIGHTLLRAGKPAAAEKTLQDSTKIQESLRPGLSDTDKVSFFDKQAASTYSYLQQALVAQKKNDAALEVAERGRARVFVELLTKRLSSQPNIQATIAPPTIGQIQQVAHTQNATLVEYSITYDSFKVKGKEKWRQSELYIWVLKPTGEVAFKQVDLKKFLNTSLEAFVASNRESIGVRGRSIAVVPTAPEDGNRQTKQLQQLHKLLIEPIAHLLPTDPAARVIFIPQGSLFLVPFPALQDASGKYLIEKHTILTAPAIQVLDLTHEQRRDVQDSVKDVLVVGNPGASHFGRYTSGGKIEGNI